LLFFSNDAPPTQIYTLSLHDALPISQPVTQTYVFESDHVALRQPPTRSGPATATCRDSRFYRIQPRLKRGEVGSCLLPAGGRPRSEEHTSELQSLAYLVCRLLLEKKK